MSPWPLPGPGDLLLASSADKAAVVGALGWGQELRAGFVTSSGCSHAGGTLSLNPWCLLLPTVRRPYPVDAQQHPQWVKKHTLATLSICYPSSHPELNPESQLVWEVHLIPIQQRVRWEMKEQRWRRRAGQDPLGLGDLIPYEDLAGCFGPSIPFLFPRSKNQVATLTFLAITMVQACWWLLFYPVFGWLKFNQRCMNCRAQSWVKNPRCRRPEGYLSNVGGVDSNDNFQLISKKVYSEDA